MRFCVITQKTDLKKSKKYRIEKYYFLTFPLMKPEPVLQTSIIQDINSDAIISKAWNDGFELSTFLWIGALMVFFIYMLHDGWSHTTSQSGSSHSNNKKGVKLAATEKKLADQVRTLDMVVRNLYIKKRETESEIRKVEMNSLSNLDSESTYDNELKVDKLNIKIEEIEVMIEKKETELQNVQDKLEQYQNENYL